MKYFLDTEFMEKPCTIDLISIGIVSEVGEKFYAINKDCNLNNASKWVIENVLKPMPQYDYKNNAWRNDFNVFVMSKKKIKETILDFIKDDKPEFWAYYSDYDWVVFCWLFGAMIDLPKNFPMYCRDLKQEIDRLGIVDIPIDQTNEHNALSDALWVKNVAEYIVTNYGIL
jgi:hypothetical protein